MGSIACDDVVRFLRNDELYTMRVSGLDQTRRTNNVSGDRGADWQSRAG